MTRIHKFEDLEAWCKARQLTVALYHLTGTQAFAHDRGLSDQLRRAAVSVMSNIAEGFERGSDAEFRRFLWIAKGSAGEIQAQLYIALDTGLIDSSSFDHLTQQVDDCSHLIGGLIRYLSRPSCNRVSAPTEQPETT